MSGFTHQHAVRLAQVPELALRLRAGSGGGGALVHVVCDLAEGLDALDVRRDALDARTSLYGLQLFWAQQWQGDAIDGRSMLHWLQATAGPAGASATCSWTGSRGSRPSPPATASTSRCALVPARQQHGRPSEPVHERTTRTGPVALSLPVQWRRHVSKRACQCGQVHISHAEASHMLVNAESLKGMAPRVRALAAREAAVSAVVPPHEVCHHDGSTQCCCWGP